MTLQELSRHPYGHDLTKLVPLITASRLLTNHRGILIIVINRNAGIMKILLKRFRKPQNICLTF
jgi:16S rRNA G1207 methylase RsmC